MPFPDDRVGLRILVVEDDSDSALTTEMLLRSYGHTVELAHDGATAVQLAKARPPDVVLLDIGLPGMNGYETAQQLRAACGERQPLVMAVTGYGCEQDIERARQSGIDLHLLKPADPSRLLLLLENAQLLLDLRRRKD